MSRKYLSKEVYMKIRCKQMMWQIYNQLGKDKEYGTYKEVLNAARNEGKL